MARLPILGPRDDADPHVFILGAGASRAACPEGDRNGRRLPVMQDFVEVVGLQDVVGQAGVAEEDFEALYDGLVRSGEHGDVVQELERRVWEYFSTLALPDTPTTYDYLLLSLRAKDVVATFNWDPFLAQAYRRNAGVRHLPQLAFLHGNVAVGYCLQDRRAGWIDDRCDACGEPFTPTPLLYPVRDKDYTENAFIANEWKVLRRAIERAYFLTVFGYSAPATDAAARDAMREVWKRNEARDLAEVEIIDVKSEKELHESWNDFIVRSHCGTSETLHETWLARHPRRSCDGFAAATLMNMPWKNNWLPETESIDELHAWIEPLLAEEEELAGSDKQFSGRPCQESHEAQKG